MDRAPTVRDAAPCPRVNARAPIRWLESVSPAKAGLTVFLGFAVVYLASANYISTHQHVDTIAAAVPAWQFVESGTLRVDEFKDMSRWFVEAPDGVYSNRFPGVIFIAVPLYALAAALGLSGAAPSPVPASMTAALVTAAAMAVLYLVFARLTPPRVALIGVVVFGLGTSTWSISGNALWTHGPAQLYLALAMLSLAGGKYAPTGLALAFAVFTRPQLAMVPFAVGVGDTIRTRSPKPAIVIGLISAVGLAAVVAYNATIFGEPSITGGYGSYPQESLTGMDGGSYLMNWFMTLFSPAAGIFLYSSFLLAAVPKVRSAWRDAPGWVRVSAIAGVAYMALQLRINIWTGGGSFFAYRLPLEMLTLLAPLLLTSTRLWVADRRGRRLLFSVAVAWAIALQAFGAMLFLPLALRS